ncbi:hypothetical protein FWF74_03420 [Candidatus Saccharibacteria bacterium]|nr:hypothetical protein [Candidatus Saccharibacteria bacterium]MCL1962898.1 hypothetical protein [Candidatus Saccharibacteria bacterium]
MRKMKSFLILTLLIIIGAVTLSMWSNDKSANAYLTGFNPGNIISDYVMGNKSTMTEAQIQTFLKSKNPCNKNTKSDIDWATNYMITYNNATTWNIKDGHFVCMADEKFGADGLATNDANGETAAHIIWQAAQDYSINPQVLIVLLEKEQGLITDQWPNNTQYKKATGYGCPDTAPCDSQYFGLRSQIRWAANLFRTVLDGGWTNYPVGVNYILYNPDRSCGGSNVNIENRATSALYRYTPYQPNAGALAAGWGTAACGAYGNRNFYNYFTSWFGSTMSTEVKSEPNAAYRVYSSIQNRHVITGSQTELNDYVNHGWKLIGKVFSYDPNGGTVYRLYSKITNSYYYTTDTKEKGDLEKNGWVDGNSTFKSDLSGRPVFKMFSQSQNIFYYTNNIYELSDLILSGWKNYGVAFYEKSEYSDPIYRLYSNISKSYYLTSDIKDAVSCMVAGWRFDGVIANAGSSNDLPVYHMFSPITSKHYYTSNATEKQNLVDNGWQGGGTILGTVPDGIEVHRLYDKNTNTNYFSSSTEEISRMIGNGWVDVGIAFYSNGDIAIRRMYNPANNTHAYISSLSRVYALAGKGWVDHGISFFASSKSGRPAYQMCEEDKKYLLALSTEQKTNALNSGLNECGIEFYYSDSGRKITVFESPITGWMLLSATDDESIDIKNHGWIEKGSFFVK